MRIQDIIIRPLITEKAMTYGGQSVYAFEVAVGASKDQVAEAVAQTFGVEVGGVKTLIRKGKTRRVGKRMKAKTLPDTKKAYVTVTKGTIDIALQ